MKKMIFVLLLLLFFSCKEDKTIFIQSDVLQPFFLVKNPKKNDELLKKDIKNFLLKNIKNYSNEVDYFGFYNYNRKTSYFLENEEDNTGGFSQNSLDQYPEYEIAAFTINKCEKDTTKLVGRLYFYGNAGLKGGKKEIDTLIYHCK